MTEPYVWWAILGITFATFLSRSSLHVLGHRLQVPHTLESALRYAPLAHWPPFWCPTSFSSVDISI